MTGQQLKNSILQWAIQGRLVPQDPSDEPASVLLQRIRNEKQTLVRQGKLKKEKPLNPITDDEKPFEIPASWEWVRLGELGVFERGSGIKRDETTATGFPCVRYGEMYTHYRKKPSFSETISFTSKEVFDKCRKAKYDDIFMALTGENKEEISLAAVYKGNEEIAISGDLCRFSMLQSYTLYFVYFINSPFAINQKRLLATGDIIVHISADRLGSILVPLPPLAEQKRIVEKIEELLPKVEEYGKAQEALDKLNSELPEKLKKSILQEAISGRLVPQDAADEPASALLQRIRQEKAQLVKQGKLKKKDLEETPISDDEIPFDIPDSWEWVRLGELFDISTGKKDANFGDEEGKYNFFTCSSIPIKSRTYSYDGEYLIMPGNGANIGQVIHYNGKFEAYQRTYLLQEYGYINLDYIKNHLMFNWKEYNQDKLFGSAIPYIKLGNLTSYLVALPPLAEQKRIVEKIEELFKEIDMLKA